jgi:hypothetical protein
MQKTITCGRINGKYFARVYIDGQESTAIFNVTLKPVIDFVRDILTEITITEKLAKEE